MFEKTVLSRWQELMTSINLRSSATRSPWILLDHSVHRKRTRGLVTAYNIRLFSPIHHGSDGEPGAAGAPAAFVQTHGRNLSTTPKARQSIDAKVIQDAKRATGRALSLLSSCAGRARHGRSKAAGLNRTNPEGNGHLWERMAVRQNDWNRPKIAVQVL